MESDLDFKPIDRIKAGYQIENDEEGMLEQKTRVGKRYD